MNDESQVVGRVADLIRDRIGDEATLADDVRGQARLAATIGAMSAPRTRQRLTLALALAAGVLLAAYGINASKLSYVVESPAAAQGEPGRPNGVVAFSDGSRLRLEADATGHVMGTGWRGADFVLEHGALEAQVVHRSFSSWSVHAGPFTVLVRGTRFVVSWSPETRRFVLSLHEGVVEVRGDLFGGGRTVRTGERLIADVSSGRITVEPDSKQDSAQANPAASIDPQAPGLAENEGKTGESPEFAPPPKSARIEHSNDSARTPGPAPLVRWPERVASGDFKGVVDDAHAQGIDVVLERESSTDLSALADAARYLGDRGLSGKVLTVQRQRFPGTERAAMAAFLMGKMAEERGDTQLALTWYDRYLDEQPRGTFGQEALGRKMVMLRGDNHERALAAAREYLVRFPTGPRAGIAHQIVGQP